MLVTWHHQPWAHRHDACGQVASSTPRLVIPVSQSRYSSGAVSSAAQAEDALVPPLRSQPQVARIAVPWSDPATLQRLTRAMATIRLRSLKATPVLLTACRG